MQGYEEKRHAELIRALMQHAGITVPDIAGDAPRDAH